ncbi:MAG TPA: FMN-binding protein [Sedimentisphaerales bacterium]|nr:FMN-binding protein [Sedimentisphaerales bacterium]
MKLCSMLGCVTVTLLALGSVTVKVRASNQVRVERTRAEVEAIIKQEGSKPPDWWDSVELKYPNTLDLSWPVRLPQGTPWNANKNVGQYIWDVINPNPPRWKEGIKLVNHLMILHKDDPAKLERSLDTLGRMFNDLLEDWARAAFWWRKSEQMGGFAPPVKLARCYWKLGSKEMAAEILLEIERDYVPEASQIRLWGEMGEVDKALELAESAAQEGWADESYLAAGDVCRQAGRYVQAAAYYQKVLALPDLVPRGKGPQRDRPKERAQANLQAIKLFDTLDLKRVPDGAYTSNSIAYADQLYVEVSVRSGRIESVKVTKHKERQFYSAFTDTIRQIVSKQSVKGIDATTGATITSEAIINATAKALAAGMK